MARVRAVDRRLFRVIEMAARGRPRGAGARPPPPRPAGPPPAGRPPPPAPPPPAAPPPRARAGGTPPGGAGDGGYRTAFDVAMELSRAAMGVEQAATAVEAAHHAAGRISWPATDQNTGRALAVRSDRRLAPPSLFGVAGTRDEPVGISRS
jgi:hypothetical protein